MHSAALQRKAGMLLTPSGVPAERATVWNQTYDCNGRRRAVHDVCVFGAGPAGLAVSARLLEQGHDVIVLDRALKARRWGGESFTGAIRGPLTRLGLWESFTHAGHVAGYERQCAWGGGPQIEDAIFHPQGPHWHVDRDRFDDDIRKVVRQRADIVCTYARLEFIANDSGVWRIKLDGAIDCRAKYVVDATGRSRLLARRLGARVDYDDRLIGLTAEVSKDDKPAEIRSMVIASLPFGWWYAAPTPKGHVVALFTDPDLVSRDVLRRLRPVAANSAFTHAHAGRGWMPVGDAYASHDPLSGWGVHRAIDNGLRLADAIDALLTFGESALLEEFCQHCQGQYASYLKGLRDRYAMERRWPATPFWKRRYPSASD